MREDVLGWLANGEPDEPGLDSVISELDRTFLRGRKLDRLCSRWGGGTGGVILLSEALSKDL